MRRSSLLPDGFLFARQTESRSLCGDLLTRLSPAAFCFISYCPYFGGTAIRVDNVQRLQKKFKNAFLMYQRSLFNKPHLICSKSVIE